MMFQLRGKHQITAEKHLNKRYQLILMNIRSFLFTFFIFLLPLTCKAQDLTEKILMSVEGRDIEAGEFQRMYKKSIEPGTTADIDTYLQQFTLFKLKVADAIKEGYDTTHAFINELKGYRHQLAENYLTDTQTREKLIQKAYQRSLTEINAWHILVAMPSQVSVSDTLPIWQKASDIRERIMTGESFEKVARATSDDESVKVNGGNLGYFTVFQMIMPFEDAVYSLKKGAVSDPVRTPYGYHIIKVADKRPSKGKIRVAHIMKGTPPGTTEKEINDAEKEINKVYKELQEGASFSETAKKYSDHKESAEKGGELNWFGAGEIISDFCEAAFSVTDTGKYTKPVKSIYGWHIIKLLEKRPPGTLEETRSYLESKINKTYLNSLSKKSIIDKLKREYKFRLNQDIYRWFIANTDTLIIQGFKKYDRKLIPPGSIYTFADQRFNTREFASYIEKRGSMIVTKDSLIFITQLIETCSSDHLLNYENSILEKKYPEFRYLMNEFYDGILLFEISGKKVWDRVTKDSIGLLHYYDEHKNNYLSRSGIEAKIYTLRSQDSEKSLLSAYNKYSKKPDTDKRLYEKFNKKNDTLLIITEGKWYKGDDPQIDNLKWNKGLHSFTRNGFPSLIIINELIKPVPLEFDEVRGEIITSYQEHLESEWVRQLKESYNVKINNQILEEIKNKLTHE